MSQKDFNERLRRIGGESNQTGPQPERPKQTPARDPKRRGLPVAMISAGAGILLLAFVAMMVAKQYLIASNPMTAYASPYLADVNPPKIILQGREYGAASQNNPYLQSCLQFFPPAPNGWVRVTSWDARYPELMPRLQAIWQQNGKTLETMPGFLALTSFVNRYADTAQLKVNKMRGRGLGAAMYFDVAGDGFTEARFAYQVWRESSTCTEDFTKNWMAKRDQIIQARAQGKKVRIANTVMFNYFGRGRTGMSSDGLGADARVADFKKMQGTYPISFGLTFLVNGVFAPWDLDKLFEQGDITTLVESQAGQYRSF